MVVVGIRYFLAIDACVELDILAFVGWYSVDSGEGSEFRLIVYDIDEFIMFFWVSSGSVNMLRSYSL